MTRNTFRDVTIFLAAACVYLIGVIVTGDFQWNWHIAQETPTVTKSEPVFPNGMTANLDNFTKARAATVGDGLTISPELKAKQTAALAPIRRCAEIVDQSMFVTKVITSKTVECMTVLDIWIKANRP